LSRADLQLPSADQIFVQNIRSYKPSGATLRLVLDAIPSHSQGVRTATASGIARSLTYIAFIRTTAFVPGGSASEDGLDET